MGSSEPRATSSGRGSERTPSPWMVRGPVIAVIAVGLATTAFSVWAAQRWEMNAIRTRFELDVADEVAALRRELDTTLDALRAVSAFYAASVLVERSEFNLFTRALIERRPGLRAMDWVPRVPPDQLEAFVQAVRDEGFTEFAIHVIPGGSPSSSTDVFPVTFTEPLTDNLDILGYDIASEPERRAALMAARDTGMPVATSLIRLIQADDPNAVGINVVMPVFGSGRLPETIEARRAQLSGFIRARFHPGEIVEEAMRHLRPDHISFTIEDVTESSAPEMLYGRDALDPPSQAVLASTEVIAFASRQWKVTFMGTGPYIHGLRSWNVPGILVVGLLLTGLAALSLGGQIGRTVRIEREVADRTRELRIANERLRQETEERRLAAEALRESDSRLRSILDFTSSVVFIKDPQGRYMLINRVYEERFHVTNEATIGRTDFDLFPAEMARAFQANDREVLKTGQAIEVEERVMQAGEERTYLSVKLPLRRESGAVYAVCGIATDITERKNAELQLAATRDMLEDEVGKRTQELRERERAMSTLVANLPGMVYRCQNTPAWPMEFVSEGVRGLTGYEPDDLLSARVSFGTDVILPEDQERVWGDVQAALAERVPYQITYRIKTRDGRVRWLWEQGQGVFNDAGELLALEGFMTDITSRILAEEALRRLNEELEQRVEQRTAELKTANRELEAFSYSVSHDLRAPLRSIDGFSQALFEDCHDILSPEGRDSLQRIRAASQRMGQLIDDLLSLSRVTRVDLSRSKIDLSAMARATLASLRQLDPDRAAEFVVEEGLSAHADPHLVQIAFDNLFGNAWKFSGKKDFTRIEFGLDRGASGSPSPGGQASRPTFFIRDNGSGFDMRYASKLFGVFQRFHTTNEFPGTGVGLATVQRIIHRHGGQIWCESEPEKGATFHFSLE